MLKQKFYYLKSTYGCSNRVGQKQYFKLNSINQNAVKVGTRQFCHNPLNKFFTATPQFLAASNNFQRSSYPEIARNVTSSNVNTSVCISDQRQVVLADNIFSCKPFLRLALGANDRLPTKFHLIVNVIAVASL